MATIVDVYDTVNRNMYGCLPCPKCKSKDRAAYGQPGVLSVECDDCGFKEPGVEADSSEPTKEG